MKVGGISLSKILEKESKTNIAATTSEEKLKGEYLNNQVVGFHSYSARKKIIYRKKQMLIFFRRMNAYKIRAWNFANLFVNFTTLEGPKTKFKKSGEDLVGGKV